MWEKLVVRTEETLMNVISFVGLGLSIQRLATGNNILISFSPMSTNVLPTGGVFRSNTRKVRGKELTPPPNQNNMMTSTMFTLFTNPNIYETSD